MRKYGPKPKTSQTNSKSYITMSAIRALFQGVQLLPALVTVAHFFFLSAGSTPSLQLFLDRYPMTLQSLWISNTTPGHLHTFT